jgi:serine protease AprX
MRQRTVIEYELRSEGPIHLDVFNAGGTKVRLLAEEVATAGRHRVIWDGRDDLGVEVPAGVYFFRLWNGGASSQQRLVLVH